MIAVAAGTAALIVIAGLAFAAARLPRTRRAFRVFDPANPERATADPHYLWSRTAQGEVVRTSRATGAVVGRYVEALPSEARLVAEWSSERRGGFRLVPRLRGRELFRIDRGDSDWSITTVPLKPVHEAVPVLGSAPAGETPSP